MSLTRLDSSFVMVKQLFIVRQIVGYPVILSLSVLLESVNKSFVSTGNLRLALRFLQTTISDPS